MSHQRLDHGPVLVRPLSRVLAMGFVTVHLEMLVKFENQATRSGITYNDLTP